jgi:transglutaminase-like putative cysteine protease
MVTCLMITGSPLPVGGALGELRTAIADSVQTAQDYAAPVPDAAPPIAPLLVICGLACVLLVDWLACTLHRVPLAGLPLLTIYSIPVSMVESSLPWWIFAAIAGGFLAMLFLQEAEHLLRWGRPLALDRETGDPIAFGAGSHVVRRTATGVGGVATALAVLLPALIPSIGFHMFDFGPGNGGGDEIQVVNPTTDLVRDLRRGDDTPLVEVTTTDPHPSYLRILTLTRFSNVEWSPGDRDVPTDQGARGPLPSPPGLAAQVATREVPYQVRVMPAFDSRWLPTQYPVSRIRADGDWRYDTGTMDFLAVPDDLTTANLRYTMTALDVNLTAADLAAAGTATGRVSETFTDVPADLPNIVRQLASDVTQEEDTRFDKAVALQDWFREDGGFTYSLDPAESGSGYDALTAFLSNGPGGRTGYCEQFASAMAIMARVLGIPARVAVGFLEPSPAGPDTWVYSSDDMHAWPELFFDGAGWVRFEPTPAGRTGDAPTYTNRLPQNPEQPIASADSSRSAAALGPSNRPTQESAPSGAARSAARTGASQSWLAPVVVGGVLAVVSAVLLLPRLVRSRRRHRRLASAAPEDLWDELRDTAIDLGLGWPAGRSPRAIRGLLVPRLGLPLSASTPDRPSHGPRVAPEAVAALDRLVTAVELGRYAPPGREADRTELRGDAELCVASLVGGTVRSARRRAAWWPRSVVTATGRARPRAATSSGPTPTGLVDRVG